MRSVRTSVIFLRRTRARGFGVWIKKKKPTLKHVTHQSAVCRLQHPNASVSNPARWNWNWVNPQQARRTCYSTCVSLSDTFLPFASLLWTCSIHATEEWLILPRRMTRVRTPPNKYIILALVCGGAASRLNQSSRRRSLGVDEAHRHATPRPTSPPPPTPPCERQLRR